MTVGLLIITHNRIGSELLDTATDMLGICPLSTLVLPVTQDTDPDRTYAAARRMVQDLDQGEGVLILTDVYGSTPSNIASRLREQQRVRVVAGVNLPMLIRVLNYPRLELEGLAAKALTGGCDGVLLCRPDPTGAAGTAGK